MEYDRIFVAFDREDLGFKQLAMICGRHDARVKFAPTAADLLMRQNFSVNVDPKPQVIAGSTGGDRQLSDRAKAWVALNHEVLRRFWSDPASFGSSRNLYPLLKPIK